MTGAHPIVTMIPPTTNGTDASSNSATNQSLQELGPNAFITLLTAQLQAQDPLNPLDPNQMVDELTSMNTLQETIQIRQDLDALVSDAQSATGTGGNGNPATGGTGGTGSGSNAATAAISPGIPSAGSAPTSAPSSTEAPHRGTSTAAVPVVPLTAANAIAAGLSAFTKSLSSKSVSGIYSQLNSKQGFN